MFGIVESLNLATSTGIVLYEISKQRREFEKRKKLKQSKK
jgi:tRNA (guanosine-2'-O-)-methyltransferase